MSPTTTDTRFPPNRRQLFQAGVALAAMGLVGRTSTASVGSREPFKRVQGSKLKLSLAAYSFRNRLTGKQKPSWTLDDFILFCAQQGLEGTELTGYYFPDNVTSEYLAHLKHLCFVQGLDISGTAHRNNFCHPKGRQRDAEIAHIKKWVDYAAGMGAPCIRIFSGGIPKGSTEKEARNWCIECLQESCDYASGKGVFLALENHGGLSATAKGLLEITKAVDSPWFGINLDSGNFHSKEPYAELEQIAPYAVNAQIKVEMRSSNGERNPADLKRVINILKDAGYRGYVVLEYEAAEEPTKAVPRYLDELRKYL